MTHHVPRVTPAVMASRTPAPRPAAAPRFDRHAWEEALLAAALPHHNARLLGWSLAHLAPASGQFHAGNQNDAGHLGRATRMTALQLRAGLKSLERAGLIVRARGPVTGQEHALARAFTLTLPSAAARTELAHTGEA
ncbi:hypothetical protein [Streptomyces fuscichromogenes]|uniref:Uncharacterized protein n=1 Tax=Streptomyces fuscichromogenes TaxID=1324013 RepID=A0A918CY56_9ACTN|nr:hypothetical protein [Streptomyces fuscichromogenes]GGN47268.1 hypothetical protein GCM10011578_100780 [Streptomyces fuscichromogenes]